jgi:hypothetical protein
MRTTTFEPIYGDGDYGEYIFPNQQLFARESALYADIAAWDEGDLHWSAPKESYFLLGIDRVPSPALDVLNALFAVGAFKPEGATFLAETWGAVDFCDQQGFEESERLTKETLHDSTRRSS